MASITFKRMVLWSALGSIIVQVVAIILSVISNKFQPLISTAIMFPAFFIFSHFDIKIGLYGRNFLFWTAQFLGWFGIVYLILFFFDWFKHKEL